MKDEKNYEDGFKEHWDRLKWSIEEIDDELSDELKDAFRVAYNNPERTEDEYDSLLVRFICEKNAELYRRLAKGPD